MKNIKYIFILALFSVSCYFSWNLYFNVYLKKDIVNIHQFPKEFDGWSSSELTITDREYEILETRNAFVREYTDKSGRKIYFFTVYSESNRKVSHPPEICYTGNGVVVLDKKKGALLVNGQEIPVYKLVLEQGNFEQVAFYWFKVGNTFTASYWKQQALIAMKTLLGQPANSALIRLSVTVQDGGQAQAEQSIRDFAQSMVPKLFTFLP